MQFTNLGFKAVTVEFGQLGQKPIYGCRHQLSLVLLSDTWHVIIKELPCIFRCERTCSKPLSRQLPQLLNSSHLVTPFGFSPNLSLTIPKTPSNHLKESSINA